MAPFSLKQIKLVRLIPIIIGVFLIADTLPHPNLGRSLSQYGLEQIQHLSH